MDYSEDIFEELEERNELLIRLELEDGLDEEQEGVVGDFTHVNDFQVEGVTPDTEIVLVSDFEQQFGHSDGTLHVVQVEVTYQFLGESRPAVREYHLSHVVYCVG